MNLISRDIINQNFKLTIIDKCIEFDKDTLIKFINRAKTYLVLERKASKGDKVLLTFGDYYVPWFFACAELGLSFVISASHVVQNYKKLNDRYGEIHHVIMPFNKEDLKGFYSTYEGVAVDMNVIKDYSSTTETNTFWATPDTTLTLAISDKYNLRLTGLVPEEHTHDFYYRLLVRNCKVMNFHADDKCFHLRVLHHGSSLGTFFLPTFYGCSTHFWCDETEYLWVRHLVDYQITRCLIFERMLYIIALRLRKNEVDLSHLKLYILTQPSLSDIDNLIIKHNITLISIFGMTSTSGPIFLQEITPKLCRTYDRRRFFKPLDNFYDLKVEDNILSISYDDRTVISRDRFEIRDDEFYFLN